MRSKEQEQRTVLKHNVIKKNIITQYLSTARCGDTKNCYNFIPSHIILHSYTQFNVMQFAVKIYIYV